MSRIGKKAIPVPSGVVVNIDEQVVTVKGKLGEMRREFPGEIAIVQQGNEITVTPRVFNDKSKPLWGLCRTLVSNMVNGVSAGFTKSLEIQGVGYRAAVVGEELKLTLGYSHEINYPIPAGIKVHVEKNTLVTVSGADREMVGQMCAEVRSYRPPEPYKGKGIRYVGERVLRKVGKKK